jgi:hypothetical protein
MAARLRSVNPFSWQQRAPEGEQAADGEARAGGGDTDTHPDCMDPKVFKALTQN